MVVVVLVRGTVGVDEVSEWGGFDVVVVELEGDEQAANNRPAAAARRITTRRDEESAGVGVGPRMRCSMAQRSVMTPAMAF